MPSTEPAAADAAPSGPVGRIEPTRRTLPGDRWKGAAILLLLAGAGAVQAVPRPVNLILLALVRALCDLLALFAVAQRRRRDPEGGRVWGFLQAGLLLFLAGDLLAGIAFVGPSALPVPEWASTLLLHLVPVPFFILALTGWKERPGGPSPVPRLHALLDGLLFGYAAYYLIWVLGIRNWEGITRTHQASGALVVRFALLGVLLGTGLYRGSRNPERWRGPLLFLGGSFLLLTVSSAFSAASILGGQGPVYRMFANVLKPAAILLIAAAAWWRGPLEGTPEAGRSRLVEHLRDHLPFAPAALATFGALAFSLFRPATMDPRVVLYGAPMVAFLLVRQFMAFQDLKRFSYRLEAKVEERTRALETAQAVAMRTERMNALAMLGAGLAHDLNNSLGAIRASAELLAEDLHAGKAPESRDLERILVASDQAAGLSRRLMAFGRDEPHGAFDLRREVHAMEDLLRMLLPRRIQLRVALGAGVLPVSGTRSHLEQILVNLISNARDAIPGEGSISIELLQGEGPAGPEALLRVQDTGTGMSPEVQERLFEPFFTTKEPGKGTGLGLVSVKALMEHESGSLEVDSQVGLGTTFILRFPLLG